MTVPEETSVNSTSITTPGDFYVNGSWKSAGGDPRTVHSPVTQDVVGRLRDTSADDIDSAVRAATEAFGSFSKTSRQERAAWFRAIADRLEQRRDEMAETIQAELGAPRPVVEKIQVQLPITALRTTADLVENYEFDERVGNSVVYREPVGVVAAITPWNYPLHQITAKIVPALAAGCTVIVKPAELTPLTALKFAEIVDDAGLPAGVVNVVPGDGATAGQALAVHPQVDMVSFTGSVAVGRSVTRDAADTIKRVSLELGGKSASIIAQDVGGDQLTTAVKVSVANCFLNSGQTCSAWTRLLVPESRYAEVRDLARAAAAKYVPGERLGPLISASQRERVLDFVREAEESGVDVIHGGSSLDGLPPQGWYVQPTVFGHVEPSARIAQEEVFGPVLCILTYRDEDEALQIANGTKYGLTGAIWAADDDHAEHLARGMRTGQVDVNGGQFNPLAPFGGYKQSGTGRELGRAGLEEYLEHKAVQH